MAVSGNWRRHWGLGLLHSENFMVWCPPGSYGILWGTHSSTLKDEGQVSKLCRSYFVIVCATARNLSAFSNSAKHGLQQYYLLPEWQSQVRGWLVHLCVKSRSQPLIYCQLILPDSENIADCMNIKPPYRPYSKECLFSIITFMWHAKPFNNQCSYIHRLCDKKLKVRYQTLFTRRACVSGHETKSKFWPHASVQFFNLPLSMSAHDAVVDLAHPIIIETKWLLCQRGTEHASQNCWVKNFQSFLLFSSWSMQHQRRLV